MDHPIKILIHGMTGNLGGMESCIMNYYRNINHEKIHFDFLCVNEKLAYYKEIMDRGGRVYIIPGRRRYIAHYQQLTSIFKENKYDGFWSNRCSFSGTSLFFKIAAKQGIPTRIIHAHSTGNVGLWFNGGILHTIESRLIEKLATDFWACSIRSGNYCFRKEIVQSTQFKIIHNAIDTDRIKYNKTNRDNTRKELALNNKLVIGHIGRFSREKNHVFLIHVFHEIYKKEPNAVLLLVGYGKLRSEIENMTKSLNLGEAVLFLGMRSDIPALLSAMDIFILPSQFEGLPVTLIEAQAMSLHCFASTKVTRESAITGLLSFIDLKETPKEWARIILEKRNYVRKDMTEEIQKAGYDIKTEAAKVEEYLLSL